MPGLMPTLDDLVPRGPPVDSSPFEDYFDDREAELDRRYEEQDPD